MSKKNNPEELPELPDDDLDDDLEDLVLDDSMLDYDPNLQAVEDNLDRFMAVASVEAVYGEPIMKDDLLLIPAAEVGSAMGFGVGSGYGESVSENGGEGGGSGGGGGGWNFSRPVAVIIVSPQGVRVEPVVDVTKVAIAALTTFGFMAGMMLRMLRPRR